VPPPSRNYLLSLLAEFTRATVAAQRYEDLRYRSAGHGRTAPDDIPRRVFEEVYSVDEAVESRRPAPRRSDSPAPEGRTAKASS
jgi:hypothetical protein